MKYESWSWRSSWRMPLVALGFLFLSYTPQASANWYWDDVQRWAYEVEDRSDEVYERAFREARPHDPDEEYALELLWDLAAKADHFSARVNAYPWGNYTYTRNDFHALYVSFYRADSALKYASFSYHVDSAFQSLSFALDRLRIAYNYQYRHDGWVYLTYRNRWYFELRYRHDRIRYERLYRERLERRRLARHRWEERYRRDARRARYERERRERIDRERRDRDRWERDRRERDRRRDEVRPQPPRREDRRRDEVRPRPPRREDRRRDEVRPQPPRRDDRGRGDNNRGGDRRRPPRGG